MLRLLFVSPVGLVVYLALRTLGLGPHVAAPPPPVAQREMCGLVLPPPDAAPRSVTGDPLQPCRSPHATGFHRDGYCHTGPADGGVHAVCAQVTDEFLAFTRSRGNDLSSPRPGFPGLREGDGWCLCADRWREALEAGVAPPVDLAATEDSALEHVAGDALRLHAARVPGR